jgi:hypothetical protein
MGPGSSASATAGEAIVSAMPAASPGPDSITMSPAAASDSTTLDSPTRFSILVTLRSSTTTPPPSPPPPEACCSTRTRSPARTRPECTRPVATRPTKGSRSIIETHIENGAAGSARGGGTRDRIASRSGAMPPGGGGAPGGGSSAEAQPCGAGAGAGRRAGGGRLAARPALRASAAPFPIKAESAQRRSGAPRELRRRPRPPRDGGSGRGRGRCGQPDSERHRASAARLLGRSVDDGEVELLVAGPQRGKQVEHLPRHRVAARLRRGGAVDLVQDDQRRQAARERLLEHKLGLRQRAWRRRGAGAAAAAEGAAAGEPRAAGRGGGSRSKWFGAHGFAERRRRRRGQQPLAKPGRRHRARARHDGARAGARRAPTPWAPATRRGGRGAAAVFDVFEAAERACPRAPSTASTSSTAPSTIDSTRSTSPAGRVQGVRVCRRRRLSQGAPRGAALWRPTARRGRARARFV